MGTQLPSLYSGRMRRHVLRLWAVRVEGSSEHGPGRPFILQMDKWRPTVTLQLSAQRPWGLLTFCYANKRNVHVPACPCGTLDKGAVAMDEKH